MSSEDELGEIILHCPNCASISKCDPAQVASPCCPNCHTSLSFDPIPPDLDDFPPPPPPPNPTFGAALITQLGSQEPSDPNLDPSRIRSTTDEELVSDARNRVRVKRSSKRVEKQLTGWDASGEEEVRLERPKRGLPIWAWLLIAGVAAIPIAAICLLGYTMASELKERDERARPPKPPSLADEARATLSDLEAASLDRDQSKVAYDRAREVAEKFLAAPTWKERLAFVREPERVGPLMEKFYARNENQDGAFAHRPIAQEGKIVVHRSLLLFMVETDQLEKIPLALEQIDDTTYRVDWESFVGLNDVPWSEIEDLRPTEPFLMRVRALRRNYYNYGFQESDWRSWQLEDRRGDYRIVGYTERGTPVDIQMEQEAAKSQDPVYVLIKVRFPEAAKADDQVEITEVLGRGWIHPSRD